MQLIQESDNYTKERYIAFIDENTQIEICKYPVLFGYRLRAGYTETINSLGFYEIDICCGQSKEMFDILFNKIVSIIKNNPKDDVFKGIPVFSKIKPYYNDQDFLTKIENLLEK